MTATSHPRAGLVAVTWAVRGTTRLFSRCDAQASTARSSQHNHHQQGASRDDEHSRHPLVGGTAFHVAGMTCDHCVHAVTTEVSNLAGVQHVHVDLASGAVEVTTQQPVDRADIAAAVDEAGYTLLP